MKTHVVGFMHAEMIAKVKSRLRQLRQCLMARQQWAACDAMPLARSQDRVVEKYLQARRLNRVNGRMLLSVRTKSRLLTCV